MDQNQISQQPIEVTPTPLPNGKKKKLLVLVVLAFALCAAAVTGLVLLDRDSSNKDIPVVAVEEIIETKQAYISVTSTGFSPAELLVTVGTVVTWVNEGDDPHLIASNPFPENDENPELNSMAPIGPESEYSFTVEEVGEYGYHDDLNPTLNGRITVFEE